jgi:hypothetical protein
MDSLRHFVRSLPYCKTVKGISLDAARIDCDPAQIDRYFAEPKLHFSDQISNNFILNIDETEIREFVDAREILVIVPSSYAGEPVFIGKKDPKRELHFWVESLVTEPRSSLSL